MESATIALLSFKEKSFQPFLIEFGEAQLLHPPAGLPVIDPIDDRS